jgi:hypothetical protein
VKLVALAAAVRLSAAPSQIPDYDRDEFGSGWADVDGDCQDTRQEILIRDLVNEQLTSDGCDVASGTLNDLYTGQTIEFQRGEGTSDDVQIDHVIPLRYAWDTGAWEWSPEQREAFANDPAELRAVDGPTNILEGRPRTEPVATSQRGGTLLLRRGLAAFGRHLRARARRGGRRRDRGDPGRLLNGM